MALANEIVYNQADGATYLNGDLIFHGYSGHGPGLNNPAMEAVHGVGPIPRGKWRIQQWDQVHPGLGPVVAVLLPVGHDAHGRTLFRIHGDNEEMNHTGSDGCIVLPRFIRDELEQSGVMDMEVT